MLNSAAHSTCSIQKSSWLLKISHTTLSTASRNPLPVSCTGKLISSFSSASFHRTLYPSRHSYGWISLSYFHRIMLNISGDLHCAYLAKVAIFVTWSYRAFHIRLLINVSLSSNFMKTAPQTRMSYNHNCASATTWSSKMSSSYARTKHLDIPKVQKNNHIVFFS